MLSYFFIGLSYSQQLDTIANKINWQRKVRIISPGNTFPITRDTLDQFPDSLAIEAKLVDYTLGISCGYLCGCGTLKLTLTKKEGLYPYDKIYVGVPCLTILPTEWKRKKKWTLYKLPLNDKTCFWTEATMNKFDTKGLAFYTLTNRSKVQVMHMP